MAINRERLDQLHSLMKQAEPASGKAMQKSLEGLEGRMDREELQAYVEHQMARRRRLAASGGERPAEPNPFERLDSRQLDRLAEGTNAILSLGARLELARRDFFRYCNLLAPDFYRPDRAYLVRLCREMQAFYEASDETVMLISVPPRHGKSRTASLFTQWVFGQNQREKVMTGSYNATLSTTFSKTVRNGIMEEKSDPGKIVYSDIFPGIRIQRGDGAMNLWALEGQYASYLATSPDGTATGFGGSLMVIDDLVKNAYEAFNEGLLEEQWKWFTDTMLSRLEEGGKIIIIMTRWASGDLAGRAQEYFSQGGVPLREVVMKAVQEDGSMLCPEILSRKSYELKTKAMSPEIASANYQQVPVDIQGRLYAGFKTYAALPADEWGRALTTGAFNYTDTADEGSDWLCSICYEEFDGEAYITDVLYTQAGMEVTEPAVARMLDEQRTAEAEIESNNGGKGFARNVQERLRGLGNRRCVVKWFHQSANKKARILTASAWAMEHIYFPVNWRDRWPEFFDALQKYQRAGKNAHDDAPDALTGVAEHFTKPRRRVRVGKRRFGL